MQEFSEQERAMPELAQQVLESSDEPLSEEEIGSIVEWIEQARADRGLLALFERGRLAIGWRNGQPIFRLRR